MRRRRRAVNLLDQHSARRIGARIAAARAYDERLRDRSRGLRSVRLALGQERDQLTIAASEVGDERSVDEDDRGADAARRPLRLLFRPIQRRAVRIGGIGRAEHDDFGFVGPIAQRSQQVERAGHRELRRAEAGDEIPAPDASRFFHSLQHRIDHAEAAGDGFRGDGFTRQDTVACEQLLRPTWSRRWPEGLALHEARRSSFHRVTRGF